MSYPPISGYYSSNTGGQNNQRSYATGESTNQSNPYSNTIHSVDNGRQRQYGSNAYNWSNQNQNLSAPQQNYVNDGWQDRQTTSDVYNYQRDQYGSSDQTTTQAVSYTSRDAYNSQDTQGLNHLAYASGLEPSATATANGNVRPTHAPMQNGYRSSTANSTSQMRTASPANSNVRYATASARPSSSTSYAQNDASSATHNHNLALNAAAALAGAVRGMYPQTQQTNETTTRASNSPIRGTGQSTGQSTIHQPTQYHVGPPVENSRKTPHQNYSTVPAPVSQTRAPQTVNTKKAPQTKPQTPKPMPKPKPAQQQATATNPQDIANLVHSTTEEAEPVYESVESQQPMPNYIDPTQVFNPYRREHERKKKEAEAEARRRAEEQKAAEEQAAKKASESSTTANSKCKIKKKASGAVGVPISQSPKPTTTVPPAPAPVEDAMAVEMQKMMSRMKEFKNTNPALFQKLWNDMRGGSNIAVPPVPPIQSPSPQIAQASIAATSETSATPTTNTAPVKARSRKSDQAVLGGPPLNGYKVVVENNPEGLPDLGRFPAERRIRQGYAKSKDDSKADSTPVTEQQQPPNEMLSPTASTKSNVPQPRADNNIAWPEPRRRAVAIAAVHYLKSIAGNENIKITAHDINFLLERNPSYLDLCTSLESRGLKFQRTTFARDLLRSVPELQTPTTKTTPVNKDIAAINSVAQGQSPTISTATIIPAAAVQTIPQALPNLHKPVQDGSTISQPSPVFTGLNGIKSEQPKPSAKPFSKPAKGRGPSKPEPPVGSKEAAARKRGFSELIDMTEIDDDENYVLPTKQPRLDQMSTADPFKHSEFNANPAQPLRFNPQPQSQPPTQQQHLPPPIAYPQPFAPQPRVDPFPPPKPQQKDGKSRMILARKLDKSEALQKSYYDPKTVARDVLIASGRHPSERPLNLHVAGMLNTFIELESDVSTFDWDTIDPGGPPPPRVEYVDIPAAPPRYKLGERVHRKRAKMTDIEETRNPEKERRGQGSTPQSSKQSRAASPTLRPAPFSNKDHHPSVENHRNRVDKDAPPSFRKISIDLPTNSQRSSRSISQQTSDRKAHMDINTPPSVKRRGRPPGAKNKNPSVTAMKQQMRAVTTEPPPRMATKVAAEEVTEKAPEPILHSYKCKWVKCHAELHNLGTLKRHVLALHVPKKTEIQAEGFVCWWKKCQYLERDKDGDIVPSRTFRDYTEWSSHIEEDHMRPIALKFGDGPSTKHTGKQNFAELDLAKFLYNPQVRPSTRTVSYLDPQNVEAARTRYLADSQGRATTPLVTSDGNAERPPDAMVLTKVYPKGPQTDKEKADITAQNAFMRAHGNRQKDTRKAAEEVVRAMEDRKQKVGPGLDRGGCTLINEARRGTLMQAPGISRIVDADY